MIEPLDDDPGRYTLYFDAGKPVMYGEDADNEDGSDVISSAYASGTINRGTDDYYYNGGISIKYTGNLRFIADGEVIEENPVETPGRELLIEPGDGYSGSEATYSIVFRSGMEVAYGEEADNEDGSDRIDGNVIRGSINSGSDNYFLDGSVTDISYTGYLRFLLDGTVLRDDTPRSDADTTTETEAPDTETETTTEDPDTETEQITDDDTETTTEPTTEGPDTETATAAPDTDTTTETDTDTPTRTRSDTSTPTPTETETGTDSDEGSRSVSDAGNDDEQSTESTDES